MSFFGLNFGQNADVDIVLDNQDERKMADLKDENGRKERLYLFYDGENVTGKVDITLHRKTHKLEHQGIRIEFIGQIELYYDRGNHHEFLSLVKQLSGPGELTQNTSFDFEFNKVEKPFECYTGVNVKLRYFLRATVVRRITDLTKEMDLLVHTLATYPEMNNPIKMEVGIEECLHIEFEYNKSKYHLKDVIVGKIYFLLVRIKIKHMEVAIIKRETTGSGPNTFHDNETIAKYEIMDGAPVKGESIPIRVFLAGYDLTPTMRDINKKFSVKYYLNLVLVDEEERRYFKQQEITLWRKGERSQRNKALPGAEGIQKARPHVIPHAMARHIAGDTPTKNIRTAPTPSEPNTPVSMPGDSQVGAQGTSETAPIPGPSHSSIQPPEQATEETEEEKPTDPSVIETQAVVETQKVVDNQKNIEIETETEPSIEKEVKPEPSIVKEESISEPSKEIPSHSMEEVIEKTQRLDIVHETKPDSNTKSSENLEKDSTPTATIPISEAEREVLDCPDSPPRDMESPPPMEGSVTNEDDGDESNLNNLNDDDEDEDINERDLDLPSPPDSSEKKSKNSDPVPS